MDEPITVLKGQNPTKPDIRLGSCGEVGLRACLVAWVKPNQAHARGPFGCLVSLLALHRTLLKAVQSLVRWKPRNQQFLVSQVELSATEWALARVKTGGMPSDYLSSSSTSIKLLSNLLPLIYTVVL